MTFSEESERIRDNLRWTDEKISAAEKLRDIAYSEAASLFSGMPSPDEAVRIFSAVSDAGTVSEEFARFCVKLSSAGRDVMPAEDESVPGNPKIAYLRNTYSDRAYRKYSGMMNNVSAQYFPGFREVCEEVYSGRCSHALLPVYSSSDGNLVTFRKLISKYDLKITSVCDTEIDEDNFMRFALVQKNLTRSGRYCEITVTLSDDCGITGLLCAFEALGAEIISLSTHPMEYDGSVVSPDESGATDIRLDLGNADRNALYLFAEGSHIRYNIIGFYDILA